MSINMITSVQHFTDVIVTGIVSTLASIIAAGLIAGLQMRWKERTRPQSLEQAKLDRLASLLSFDIQKRNRLVVEQHFRAIFGTLYEYREILCILNSKSPLTAFTLMKTVRHLVEFDEKTGEFAFRAPYTTDRQRKWKRIALLVAYAISVNITFSPWYFYTQHPLSWLTAAVLFCWTGLFGFIAVATLDLSTDISATKRFMSAAAPAVEKANRAEQDGPTVVSDRSLVSAQRQSNDDCRQQVLADVIDV
jgi:hypothetical protein